jgi:hypothetical protein
MTVSQEKEGQRVIVKSLANDKSKPELYGEAVVVYMRILSR